MGSIWLFAYNAQETDDLLAKLRAQKGLIAVAYTVGSDGRKMLQIIEQCQVTGNYHYERTPTTDLSLAMHSEDEAKLMLPVSYGAFSAAFKQSSTVEIKYRSPGSFFASDDAVSISGDCSQATHVIGSLSVGAYETHIASAQGVSANAGAAGQNLGGVNSSDSSEQKVSAGDFNACESGDSSLAGAPEQCAQPLRIKLREIKKLDQNVEACNDDAFMVQGHGYAFDGKVFTIMSDQLGKLDSSARVHFACDESLIDAEADAVTEVMSFLDQNPSVKAHISVRCNTASMMAIPPLLTPSPDLHANALRGLVGKYVSAGKVTIDSCYVPGSTGVFIELTAGCKEGSVAPGQLACMAAK